MKRYKFIYIMLFAIIQIFFINTNISFSTDNKQTIEDGIYAIKTVIDDKYGLDVSQASKQNQANIQLYEYRNVNQQKFKIKYEGNGYYSIRIAHSAKALDVAWDGKVDGTNVWQYELNGTDAQKWMIKDVGDGTYNIISKSNGLYLSIANREPKNETNVLMKMKNDTNTQKFKFEKTFTTAIIGEQTIPDGVYSIKTVLDNKYGLDVSQASTQNQANIQLYEYKNVKQQNFNVKYQGDGYYIITVVHSGKAVDVAWDGKIDGTNVWQYELNGTDAQKWVIQEAGDGTYNIISKSNNLYLSVVNETAQNETNVLMKNKNGFITQKFKFEKVKNRIINIDTNKYPGYKEKIEVLMKKHPKWKFELLYTGLTFGEVVKGEISLHSRNLVPTNYGGEWVCSKCGTTLYDSGWYCASEKAVAYYMDPRNFLDESNIFQFQNLNGYINGVCTLEGIKTQINGTYLQDYASVIDNACKNQNVNSYYIITRMIQEQGREGTSIGKGMDGGNGQTYYNPFNIGASGNGWDEIYANALATAKKYGWNTMQKAIEGGIEFCKKNWLENYQNTLYQNKFDIDSRNGTPLYQHQYMQNLMGAYSESRLMRGMYVDTNKLESEFTFIIPVYEKMSVYTAQIPVNNSNISPINVKVATTAGLNLREGPSTNSRIIKTIRGNEELLSVERGINGDWHKIITKDGTIGYMSGLYLKQINNITNCNYIAKVKTSAGNGCNVRVGPSTRVNKLTTLSDGTSVKVINIGTYNNIDGYDWCRIELPDGSHAFMPTKYLI